jgi:glycosyltransferase involved in cell wall biosynthesis
VKKLKVAINARILDTDKIRGWSRYTTHLIQGLLENNIEVILFADKPINQNLYDSSQVKLYIEKSQSYFKWEQRVLANLSEKHNVDILHCPINYGLPLFLKTKKILTLHDAIEKSYYDQRKTFFQRMRLNDRKIRLYHKISQWAADHIITVSQHAKQDIINSYGVSENKISVIYEAADSYFLEKNVLILSDLQKKYPNFIENAFFYVGGLEDRKNIYNLIKAYNISCKKKSLLIAGGTQRERLNLQNYINNLGLEKQIKLLEYIEQADLPSFYHYCHCFIYPSVYEGFGLQAVEAMQMKKPVLGANNTSLKEVIGLEECLFDPFDIQSLAKKMDWMTQENIAKDVSVKSFEQSKKFSWQKCIEQTIEIYKKVLNDG